MTGIVGLFVCPYFACILSVMLGYVVWYGLIFLVWYWCVAMYLNLSSYVLGLFGLHLNLSHTATSIPLGKSKEHQFSQWKPLTAGRLEVGYLGHLLTVH